MTRTTMCSDLFFMAQEIGAAVIGLVSWELKGLLLHWKPITGDPVRNRKRKGQLQPVRLPFEHGEDGFPSHGSGPIRHIWCG